MSEPLTAEEEADLRRGCKGAPEGVLVLRLLATLAAARDRPGLDVALLATAINKTLDVTTRARLMPYLPKLAAAYAEAQQREGAGE